MPRGKRSMLRDKVANMKTYELRTKDGLAVFLKLTVSRNKKEGGWVLSFGTMEVVKKLPNGHLIMAQDGDTRETGEDSAEVTQYISEVILGLRRRTKAYIRRQNKSLLAVR